MKNDDELKTFEELLEEQEEAMKDPRYKEYERQYLGKFISNEDMDGLKFDRELLKKELDYMAQDVLLVNDIGYGGATMIRPYVGERINVNPVDDARNIVSLKEMLNKQFGKEGHIEK